MILHFLFLSAAAFTAPQGMPAVSVHTYSAVPVALQCNALCMHICRCINTPENIMPQLLCQCLQHANAAAMLTFQYATGDDCSILISKTSNKFRLQGTSQHALWLPLQQLLSRLQAHFGDPHLHLQLEEPVPVHFLQQCIQSHFDLWRACQQQSTHLDQAAGQVCPGQFRR